MTYSLGIDLGTTYTAAAVVRAAHAEVVTLSYRTTSIPSVVVLTEDGTFVVGDPAERRALATPERLAREFKRRVGDPTPLLLGGTPVSIDRLLAEVLGYVHRTVAATEGRPPASTVVTHPANWGPFKRDVLTQALRLAEIEGASLLPEPVAAATWYARAERLAPGATVAVYDLGGGTFDAAVLEMGADGTFAVRGQPEGIERLGGIDVDAAVMGHVLRVIGPAAVGLDPEDAATAVAMAQLRRDCVEAKEALSGETSVAIAALLPRHRETVLLHRRELEELIAPLIAPTTGALARAVASAGLGAGQPDAVRLVGGASRTPMVAREVAMALGRPVAVDAHPKHPVALGAALVAAARAPATAGPAAARPGPVVGPGPLPAGFGPVVGPGPLPAGFGPVVGGGAAAGAAAGPQAMPAGSGPVVRGGAVAFAGGRRPGPDQSGPGAPAAVIARAAPASAPRWSPPGPPAGHPSPPSGAPPRPTPARRRPGLIVAAVVGVVALAVAAVVSLSGGDGGDRARGGETTTTGAGAGPLEPEAPGGARRAWSVELGEETIGDPAIDAQRVYVVDSTGRLTAIDMASGQVAWEADLGDDASGVTPVVAGDQVIASASDPNLVQALDAATGAVRWTVPDVWFAEPPVVVGDTVVVSSGAAATALALADGSVRWETPFDDSMLWTGLVPAGDQLVAGTSDGRVVGIDAATGAVRFVTPVPRGDLTIWSVAVVGGTVIAYDDDSSLTGISLADGSVAWALDASAQFPGSMAALGDSAAVWLESGDLVLLDPATGEERDRVHDGSNVMLALPGDPPLLVVAGVGSLRALAPDATQEWSTELPVAAQTVAASGDALVVADFEGNVAGYRLG